MLPVTLTAQLIKKNNNSDEYELEDNSVDQLQAQQSQQSQQKYKQQRKHKSEYIKPSVSQSTSGDDLAHGFEELQQERPAAADKKRPLRYTDGYFLNTFTDEQPHKLSILEMAGHGINADRISQHNSKPDDFYQTYDTSFLGADSKSIFPVKCLQYAYNNYMHVFSVIMRYFGAHVNALERRFGSAALGYAMMAVSTILHVIPTIYVKCNKQIDYSIALMARGLITMVMIFGMASVKAQPLGGFCRSDNYILVLRAILAAIPQLYFFFAVTKLPLSLNYVVFNTGPIFVFLLSALLFKGVIQRKEVIGIAIAIVGMVSVTNPNVILSILGLESEAKPAKVAASHFEYAQGMERLIYTIFFVLVYVGWAYGILIVKKLKEANTFAMNFYVAIACLLSGMASFYLREIAMPSLSILEILSLIFIVGLFSFGSQYTFITSTFLNHNHGPLSMLNYLSVVESYIVQILFFDEIPSAVEIIGSLLVLVGLAKILLK